MTFVVSTVTHTYNLVASRIPVTSLTSLINSYHDVAISQAPIVRHKKQQIDLYSIKKNILQYGPVKSNEPRLELYTVGTRFKRAVSDDHPF